MCGLTRHGLREIALGTIFVILLAFGLGLFWWPLAFLGLPILAWLLAFFRDPERRVPSQPECMVSPADGKVTDITELPQCELLEGPAVRIGIFLSVFNVHINRAPCDGKVLAVHYKKGKFINALSHEQASEHNESNTIVLADPQTGRPIAVVKQIVGLIARRIICTPAVGDVVARGQRIGMIKFGSRTELFIPVHLAPRVVVRIGQPVYGAATVLATLHPPAADVPATDQSHSVSREP